ncbi:MAG: hypothetical protein JW741_28870 [Sedimentisphaerales bacterium]|nr:hypothetical protein [Sedimentisphaerales bacterium]
MKKHDKLEEVMKKDLDVRASDEALDRMREIVLDAHGPSTKTESAATLSSARRKIMRNPIAKFAVAAAVIAAVLVGVTLFRSSGSGVVWAEVAQKIEASRGVIYRERRGTDSQDALAMKSDYGITYLSPTQYRAEGFKNDQCWITMYDNRATAKRVVLLHALKQYVIEDITLTDEGDRKHANYQDPTYWVRKFLACEYTKLTRREIDGVLCEGIETTDPAFCSNESPGIESLIARLWVSIKTGYPVLLEGEFHGESNTNMTFDQFQWDAEFDASVFEPNIPTDYEQM